MSPDLDLALTAEYRRSRIGMYSAAVARRGADLETESGLIIGFFDDSTDTSHSSHERGVRAVNAPMGGVYRFWAVNAPKRRLERPEVSDPKTVTTLECLPRGARPPTTCRWAAAAASGRPSAASEQATRG